MRDLPDAELREQPIPEEIRIRDAAQDLTSVPYYCVDEASDGTLLNGKDRSIIGNEGYTLFFILGFADISDPAVLARDGRPASHRLVAERGLD